MASGMYLKAKAQIGQGAFNWLSDVFRWMLLTDAHTPDFDLHDFVDDVSAQEVSVGGYARQTVTSPAVNEDTAGDEAEYDCADPTFSSLASGETIGFSAIYKQVGGSDATPADDRLLVLHDLTDTPTNGGDVTLQVDAEGAFKIGGVPA